MAALPPTNVALMSFATSVALLLTVWAAADRTSLSALRSVPWRSTSSTAPP